MISRRMVVVFFAAVFSLGIGVMTATAQQTPQNPVCTFGHKYFFDDPRDDGAYDCDGFPGTFAYECLENNTNCSPQPETRSHCPSASKPVCLSSGNTYIAQQDLMIPGLGGGLSLVRIWNSTWPINELLSSVGVFGPHWKSTFEERIFVGGDHYIKYARSDGDFWSYGYKVSGSGLGPVAPYNNTTALARTPLNWILTFPSGEKRLFDGTSGLLTAIIDRNGNTTQVTYDSLNRLTTVTDSAGRTLTFTYGSPTSLLVTGVTSSVGHSLAYTYDSQQRLSTITNPDSTTISFTYDSASNITSVLDNEGKVLESHTYGAGGYTLSSSQANGVNAISITYPQTGVPNSY